MPVQLDLSQPRQPTPPVPAYVVQDINLHRQYQLINGVLQPLPAFSRIAVVLVGGASLLPYSTSWEGEEADSLLKQLNKANFTVKPMERHILERVQAKDPDFAGSFSGSAD